MRNEWALGRYGRDGRVKRHSERSLSEVPSRPQLVRVRVGLGLLVAVATGCQLDSAPSAGSAESSTSEERCEWLSASRPMAADAPQCGLEFREVVRLEGSIDGTIPDAPIRALRDGTYISGTEGFVRSFRLPAHGSVSSGVTYGDQVILSVAATDGWQAYRIDGDSRWSRTDMGFGASAGS